LGLGKTVMTLALLAWRKEHDGLGTSLIVCPASMIGTWRREIERFAPALSVFVLHGGDRHAGKSEIAKFDVVITTYALLVREVDTLRAVRFRHAVYDEAQNIKNADAVSTRAARLIEADQHLALSGTPVENRLDELWSIMECCNPGMLGERRTFQRHFERPIAEDPKHPAATELRAIVRPFMLRRRKSEVLDDLPPKQEIDVDCELSGAHRRLYDSLAAAVRREIENAFAAGGLAKNTFSVLTALLRLRQMACDPRLVDANADGAIGAKRAAFLDLVQQLVAEKRRALVFSQFVKLFDLWRPDLDARGIAYEYLDGSTVDRDRVVQRFQNGDAPLFLLSLKAGGTGLTLTAADTVIHLDPWWNPAVETQATDRAHRIGQKQSVTVYRLVAKGTIEDRIDELKKRKRDVADAIVSDAGGALGGLGEEDVLRLLGQSDG
jgi:SNF2 family DNA or RNA helicase